MAGAMIALDVVEIVSLWALWMLMYRAEKRRYRYTDAESGSEHSAGRNKPRRMRVIRPFKDDEGREGGENG